MDLLESTYNEIFSFPEGKLLVMADLFVLGALLELRELAIYPLDVKRLELGASNLRKVRREIERLARQAGFKKIRILAKRESGASPGRIVLLERDL